jgi:hypothetical protein
MSQQLQQTFQSFLSHENMQLLWEVIIDDDNKILQTKTREGLAEINQSFNKNIQMFYEKEVKDKITDPSKPINLMDMNKRFIGSMSAFLRKKEQKDYEFKTLNEMQQQQLKQPAITKEEIEMERKSKFERELERKQNDFVKTISKPVPPVPKFQDDIDDIDKPINLEEEMKKIVTQRQLYTIPIPSTLPNIENTNTVVEPIPVSNPKPNPIQNWLKPQETRQVLGHVTIGEEIESFDIDKYNSRHTPSPPQIVNNLNGILKTKTKSNKNISWNDQLTDVEYDDFIEYDADAFKSKYIPRQSDKDKKIDYIISKIETLVVEVNELKAKMSSISK